MYNLRKRQTVVVAVGTIIRHVNSEEEDLDAKDRLEEDEVDVSMEKKDTKSRDVLLEEDNFWTHGNYARTRSEYETRAPGHQVDAT